LEATQARSPGNGGIVRARARPGTAPDPSPRTRKDKTIKITAKAAREGNWWAIEVPEIPGLTTRVKRLDQIKTAVVFAARKLGHDHLEVAVEPQLPPSQQAVLDATKTGYDQLREAEAMIHGLPGYEPPQSGSWPSTWVMAPSVPRWT